MGNKDKTLYFIVLLVDIIMLLVCAIGTRLFYSYVDPAALANIQNFYGIIIILIISFIASFALFPSITQKRFVKHEHIVSRVLATSVSTMLFTSLLAIATISNYAFPRKFIFTFIAVFTILLLIERLCIRKVLISIRSRRKNIKNIILVGKEYSIKNLYQIFQNPIYGYKVKAYFTNEDIEIAKGTELRENKNEEIISWLKKHPEINEVYAYYPKEMTNEIKSLSRYCDNNLIRFYYVPAINAFHNNVMFDTIENIPIVARRKEPLLNPVNRFIKRAFDLFVSSCFLVFIYPFIYIFVAIMIKLKSPGPIYFKQERTGIDGKVFKCIKFRSMKVNDDADKVQATKDDPRKYPFGDFMRKTNIDELPQFINVWKGDMSLVGPRPHMLKHTEEYSILINKFMVKHFAKPGITGLAQVSGFRGETKYISQMEGRVKKDIEYIENWSFLLDIKIMIKTVTNMFEGEKNAY
ncbi:MAG: undecaprenyl-phosphate glucose phosphotransferase [Bacteroidaceae bacterium]|nr:undecaprenyl-phosphate glucose phosphotransferase [Bacteroidaceae bacterium]